MTEAGQNSAGVWFQPTSKSAACHYKPAYGHIVTFSTCGTWRTRLTIKDSKPHTEKVVPDFEICAKCAAALGLRAKPQRPVVPHFSLLSREEYTPLEDLPPMSPRPEDPPDELEGVDVNEL